MIGFNVKQLAELVVSAHQLEKSVKRVVVERLVDAAVDVYNHPHRKDNHMVSLNRTLIDEYGVTNPPGILADYLKHLTDEIRKHCWDERLRIVLCKENPDIWKVKMDLDGTFIDFKPATPKEEILNEVMDTPSLDQLNELLEKTRVKITGSTEVRSIRQSAFVGSDSRERWYDKPIPLHD